MIFRIFILFLVFVSCSKTKSQEKVKPFFIDFKYQKDSIQVIAKSSWACPTHLKLTDKLLQKDTVLDFNVYEKKTVLKFQKDDKDSTKILEQYKFKFSYGTSYPIKSYDTLYNYGLPFLKGKRYKILQGQNTNFTHKGPTSRYAIDFKMNVGQTVCAMKDGIVISVKEDSNKGGKNKKYLKDGNYVMLYHKDGLFTQYVHLKKDGVIVEKGDTIKKGQPIAYSGNTGYSTQPHLHFGVFKATPKRFVSIPYILDSIPSRKYVKGKFAFNN